MLSKRDKCEVCQIPEKPLPEPVAGDFVQYQSKNGAWKYGHLDEIVIIRKIKIGWIAPIGPKGVKKDRIKIPYENIKTVGE